MHAGILNQLILGITLECLHTGFLLGDLKWAQWDLLHAYPQML